MKSREQVVEWARQVASLMQQDMKFVATEHGGGYWKAESRLKSTLMARAASGLDFLRENAGSDSEWFNRGRIAYESNGDRSSFESGVYALAETLALWADQLESGLLELPTAATEGVREVASTDLMEQVGALLADRSVHVAAPIVLAGAALETSLRAAIEERMIVLDEGPGIAAYGRALRKAGVITKQDQKDLDQMAGLRNAAAHGEFQDLSRERAGLMEQQVNLFLVRLRDLLGDTDSAS